MVPAFWDATSCRCSSLRRADRTPDWSNTAPGNRPPSCRCRHAGREDEQSQSDPRHERARGDACNWLVLCGAAAAVPLLRAAPARITSSWRPVGRVLVPNSRVLGEGRHDRGQPGISPARSRLSDKLVVLCRCQRQLGGAPLDRRRFRRRCHGRPTLAAWSRHVVPSTSHSPGTCRTMRRCSASGHHRRHDPASTGQGGWLDAPSLSSAMWRPRPHHRP
jgi:hypothetical protein